jgi:filamentous hemagglutinin
VDSSYANVVEQSGIRAGDEGFRVNVTGNTDLKGGVIASTDKAVAENKNTFTTASLTTSDIQNKAAYDANAVGVSIGISTDGKPVGTGAGIGSESGSANSVTQSGITGIAANTNVRTTDVQTGIQQIFDAQSVQKNVDGQVAITKAFGSAAANAVGTYAQKHHDALLKQAANESDLSKRSALIEDAKAWDEGGSARVALHAVIGGLTGNAAGAIGAGTAAAAAPSLNDLQNNIVIALQNNGVSSNVAQTAGQLITGATAAGIGAAASGGSTAGAATAFNSDMNNRQLHQNEYDFAKKYKKLIANKLGISEADAEGRIVAEMQRNSDKQTADASGGIHDYAIRSILGCQNLNCNGDKNDPNYADHNYNVQYVKPNQTAYNEGQSQLGVGQTYNQLVTSNIKKDPVGATVAGAGMIGLGVATAGGAPALGTMIAGGTIGGGANVVIQYGLSGNVNSTDAVIAAGTGALSVGTSLLPAIFINTGGAVVGSVTKGENPNGGAGGAAIGTVLGYGTGKIIETNLDKVMNPWWRSEWKDIGLGITAPVSKNNTPFVFGTSGSSFMQEIFGDVTKKKIEATK